MVLLTGMTQLGATGPCEMLARMPGASLALITEHSPRCAAIEGFQILPTTTLHNTALFAENEYTKNDVS